MKHHQTISTLVLASLFTFILFGCETKDPSKNSPTSGNLILYVDEAYENLIRPLADSFTTNHAPDMNIEIRTLQARDAVEELINLHIAHLADTSTVDTAAAVAIIIGRSLLEDERKIIADRHLEKELMDIPLAWDGLALVVPNDSPLQETTMEQLKESLMKENRTLSSLQEAKGSNTLRFIFPSPNSSSYGYVRSKLLNGSEPATPARWVETTDSVLDQIANGEGIGLMAWYPAHLDSLRLRTLRIGFTDSTGVVQPPVRIHPVSLVMNKYPMKLRIVGYSFSGTKSPANGFLSWLARSDVAQHEMGNIGLEPENVRFLLTTGE
ncbi:MAG: substrate-binding domain-containing protein [Candidatus Kapaibacterium sp.]